MAINSTGNILTLTDRAVAQLKTLLEREQNSGLSLRVFVSSGGCSGFSYGMALDDAVEDEDQVAEQDGVKVIIDEMSAAYLQGAEVDYVDSLMGAGFTVQNPNAISTCSCGHSFDTGEGGTRRPCH